MRNLQNSINWVTLAGWHRAEFAGLADACGLFRVRLNAETMFLGHAAKGGLGARLSALKRPGQNYYAGRMIYNHRKEIEMQIAIFDEPEQEILRRMDALIAEGNPPWNVPDGHHHYR